MKTKKLIETGTRVKYAVGKGFAEGTVINNDNGHLIIRTKNGGKTGRDQAKVTKVAPARLITNPIPAAASEGEFAYSAGGF